MLNKKGWAIGGDDVRYFKLFSLKKNISYLKLFLFFSNCKISYLPSDLAYPVGGSPNEFKYFMLEIHYNNPNLLPGNILNNLLKILIRNFNEIDIFSK